MKAVMIFDDILEKLSRWGIVITLLGILFFALLAIVLRWLGQSLMWVEPLTRHLVFLSAFFGGSLATSKDVHIKVDLLTKLIENSKSTFLKRFQRNMVALFCFIACAALFKSGWDFFLVEREFGAPSFLNIHSSWLVGIIPFGMGLVTLRFLNQLILGIFSGQNNEHNRL